jgi:hypothetical protein
LVGVGADAARTFFITNAVTDAAREGALYATHHGNDPGQTAANLQIGMLSVMGAADQGSALTFHCPSWPASPSSPSSPSNVDIQVTGTVPPGSATVTTVAITANCDVTPILSFLPLANPVHVTTAIHGAVVPQN